MVNDHVPARGGPCSLEGGQEKEMSKQIIFYEFYVMDWGWEAFPTIPETIRSLIDQESSEKFDELKRLSLIHI